MLTGIDWAADSPHGLPGAGAGVDDGSPAGTRNPESVGVVTPGGDGLLAAVDQVVGDPAAVQDLAQVGPAQPQRLALNAVVLWNTRYTDAAHHHEGHPVGDDDVARLSPMGDVHINMLGRYAFTTRADAGLRPLRKFTGLGAVSAEQSAAAGASRRGLR